MEHRIRAIQAGDEKLRETIIVQYRPFITKTAGRVCRRYIDPDRDDEFSVALAAFDEAINRYAPASGRKFIGFAKQVITRRLIDYLRQEKRHSEAVPYSSLEADDGDDDRLLSRAENAAAMEVFQRNQEAERRREEIAALAEELALYGIRFRDLADTSPRHRDSRQALLGIGNRLAGSPELFRYLQSKRQLPVKEICAAESVSRKMIERHRKYLIAVSLIAGGPYPCLKQYIYGDRSAEEERS